MTNPLLQYPQQQALHEVFINLREDNSFKFNDTAQNSNGQAIGTVLDSSQFQYVLAIGIITEVCPLTNSYVITLNGTAGTVKCGPVQSSGSGLFTLADSSRYAIGATVLIAYDARLSAGYVLGVTRPERFPGEKTLRNFLDNSTRVLPDPSDRAILSELDPQKAGVQDYSYLTLADSTEIGEFGKSAYTGMKLFLNPYVAAMTYNDYTGLWVFEDDSLTRLSGINLQIRSTGRELEYLNDTGEYIEYNGSVLYPWETLGCIKPSGKIIKHNRPETWKDINAVGSFCDPVREDAKPFHRYIEFGGWLGQGKQTQVVAPPKGASWVEFHKKDTLPCLSRLTQSVDGLVSVESSKGILITKRGMFPGAARIDRPDEPKNSVGDNETNYDNEKLELPKDLKTNNGSIERAVGISDYQGYNLNWKNVFPYAYHKKDYNIPEESSLEQQSAKAPIFSKLKTQQYLDDETSYNLDIDERRKDQEFYPTEAGIALLPEGGIVIYDGYGGEIRMVGGNVTISAPGDISIKPGRSAHVWAGTDIIERAGKNIELSATENAVRVKAEKHLELLGGNSGQGGVIIESKGSGEYNFEKPGDNAKSAGVIIKAAKGTVAAVGKQIYARSGFEGRGSGIYLDAAKGKDSIYTLSKDTIEYVAGSHTINMGTVDSKIDKSTKFSKNQTVLAGDQCIVEGITYLCEQVYTGNDLFTVGTLFATDPVGEMFVGKINDKKNEFKKTIEEAKKIPTKELPKNSETIYDSSIEPDIYKKEKIGNNEVLVGCGFTFRTKEQYKAPEPFVVYEDRWQNIVTNSGSSANKWKEKSVKSTSEETYPFPGKDYYTGSSCYVTQDSTIINFKQGYYKDRLDDDVPADPYRNPKFGDQKKQSLQDYKVI